jgi:hypothetical protein
MERRVRRKESQVFHDEKKYNTCGDRIAIVKKEITNSCVVRSKVVAPNFYLKQSRN